MPGPFSCPVPHPLSTRAELTEARDVVAGTQNGPGPKTGAVLEKRMPT